MHRRDYEHDGFLVLERFVDPAACDALIARAGELVRGFRPDTVSIFTTREQTRTADDYFLDSGDKIRFFFEEDAIAPDGSFRYPLARSINKIGHALHDLDPVFSRFSRDPRLAELIGALGIAQPLLLQSMYIFKQPFVGGEVTAHQDHTYLWTDPPSATGLWFALEDATVGNGCLWVRPGGHTEPPRKRFHRRPGGGASFELLDDRDLPFDGMVPLEVPRGTCIVLHGLLPHYSGPNRSPISRQAYTLHVIDAAAHYRSDNWLQRSPALPLRGF
ncbi:MAG: phytanoyl-CoA dioxygenase family protein [Deltaproteobacteria bacterium]|nr:MAG: phytanoyl-CoA dioxygenase family protein [Deltaproteobacteria bacterium]TMQ17574.1 MAG: phytanoyl-CoA dioxygenase family protein [Deltaproteobacteria bacterium]